jgi:cation:H+ antiporter
MGLLPQRNVYPAFFLFLFFAAPLREVPSSTIFWAAPAILFSALMIAWAAESAQYFIAQGFALAILAWMQTLPEFAVEAVFAWKQQVPLLLANLTGALRLLTGFGWPVIYFTAAFFHRRRHRTPLRGIRLHHHHAVEVIGLLVSLLYIAVLAVKGTITLLDAIVLIAIYSVYLFILSKLPPEEPESIEELEIVPRTIVQSRRPIRIATISALFLAGGLLIYYSADPFAMSLLSFAAGLGIPSFIFVQWVAPIVSEFPEMASTIYFARTVERAPMALMNMVSSNINQWTLLVAMLPVVYTISVGHPAEIPLDAQQRLELWMTLGQALVGMMFLINMELAWWEATVLFGLFLIPFAIPAAAKLVTVAYFAWAGLELIRLAAGKRKPAAFIAFAEIWKAHFTRGAGSATRRRLP